MPRSQQPSVDSNSLHPDNAWRREEQCQSIVLFTHQRGNSGMCTYLKLVEKARHSLATVNKVINPDCGYTRSLLHCTSQVLGLSGKLRDDIHLTQNVPHDQAMHMWKLKWMDVGAKAHSITSACWICLPALRPEFDPQNLQSQLAHPL